MNGINASTHESKSPMNSSSTNPTIVFPAPKSVEIEMRKTARRVFPRIHESVG